MNKSKSKIKITLTVLACTTVMALSGCSNSAKQKLGLGRHSPDEFSVVKRAPLSMPPGYNLRPPQPGAPRPQQTSTTQQAQKAIFGDRSQQQVQQALGQSGEVAGQDASSSGETALLNQVGAAEADPGIREVLQREQTGYSVDDENLADKIMFWKADRNSPPPASVVDAGAEAERIKKNQEEGKKITEGDVPVIEPKKRAPLEGLFD